MKNFFIGLGLGVAGAILWGSASFVAGVDEAFGAEPLLGLHIFIYAAYAIMIGGPLTFWVILPIIKLIRRRKGE